MTKTKCMFAKSSFWLGVFALVLGVFLVASPSFAVTLGFTFEILVGWALLILGVMQFIHAFQHKDHQFWAFLILSSLLIVTGGFLAFNPAASVLVVTTLLPAFFLLSGIVKIIFAFYAPKEDRGLYALSGVISIIIAALVWGAFPIADMWFIGLLFGIYLIPDGVALIVSAARK